MFLKKTLRKKLLKEMSGKDAEDPAFFAGMPMSLTSHTYLPLWGTFLRALGGKVVLSHRTSERTMKRGMRHTQAEFCAPVIAGHGHVADLVESGPDFIFMPHMIAAEKRKEFNKSHFCPFVQSHPSVVEATSLLDSYGGRFVSPVIAFPRGKDAVARSLHASLRPVIGATMP